MEDRRGVNVLIGFPGRWGCFLRRFGAGSFPGSGSDPAVVTGMQGPGNREQALGDTRFFRFVDCSGIECHGNRRRFIGTGVVKLPFIEDDDGDEMTFAVGGEFQQSEGARTFAGSGFAAKLRPAAAARQQKAGKDSREDDAAPQARV